VEYYAQKIGVSFNGITIRCQRTRWGSCSSKGNLNFNCLLVLLPDEIIDSVVVHELCHLKQMNHSPKFYAEIEKILPDYKIRREWLKQNSSKYMSRIPK
jgi:predicted metal-dependent hydrolase